ncbi:MAG: aminotransferase class I/II-fold pyridoxal phosphate-dependent enzyme [Candidatus Helarchaeota archaeon]
MVKQAIILCAGQGKRLRPLTDKTPKCLIEVNKISLLENALKVLENNGIKRVILVTGYLHENVKKWVDNYKTKLEIIVIYNELYNTTNNIYSLYCAKDYLNVNTLLLECDLFYENSVIQKLLLNKAKNAIVVDKFNIETMNGTVVKTDDNNKITKMILPKFQDVNFDYTNTYKTVNIYKFNNKFLKNKFIPYLELYIKSQSLDNYYEIILAIFIDFYKIELYAVDIENLKWMEIDNEIDLQLTENLFKSKEDIYEELKTRHGGYWDYNILDFSYLYNSYFPPKKLYEELSFDIEKYIRNYPSSQKTLCKKMARYLNISDKNLLMANGSAEIIKILKQFAWDWTIPIPTFNEYEADLGDNLIHYISEYEIFENKYPNSCLLIINPNNPSGLSYSKKQLKNICKSHSGIVLIDESFIDFSNEESMLSEIETYNNLVIIKSMSKDMGIAGLRLGWCATQNKEIMEKLKKSIPIWNINSLAEKYIDILYKYKKDYDISLRKMKEDRTYLYQKLLLNVNGLAPKKSQSNFILCKLLNINSKQLTRKLFMDHNIFIKDCSNKKGLESEKYIRIAVKTKKETDILIQALNKVLN